MAGWRAAVRLISAKPVTLKSTTIALVALISIGNVQAHDHHDHGPADNHDIEQSSNIQGKTKSLIALHKQWQAANGQRKQALKQQMIAEAKARRGELQALMATDPAAALRTAIPHQKQSQMPTDVQDLLEQRLQLSGELEMRYEEYEGGTHKLRHFLNTPAGDHLELKINGKAPNFKPGQSISLDGLVLGSDSIEDDSDGTIAVDSEGLTLELGSSADGGSNYGTPSIPANTLGEQRTLVILVNFQDKQEQPYTKAHAQDVIFNQTSDFFMENSFGQTWLTGDITGWHTIPVSSTSCNTLDIAAHANAAAQNSGYNLSNYTRLVYAFPENACGFWGTATVGQNPSKAWLKGNIEVELVAHEMGHNLGLHHSHALDCSGKTIGDNCKSVEYGDSLDIMGWSPSAHYGAFPKEYLGWLNNGSSKTIQDVTQSGTYQLDVYASQNGTRPKALKILKGVDDFTGKQVFYYVEYRQPVGFDSTIGGSWISGNMLNTSNVLNGVIVRTGSPEESSNTSYLLDMTPETYQLYPEDPALTFGKSFTDPEAGVTIQADWGDSSTASVTVTYGGTQPSSCTRANPTLSLSPNQSQWVAAGTTVTFNVTVTNNDSSGCSNNSYSLANSVPAGWGYNWSKTSVSLAPGSSATASLTVTSSSSAIDGFYNIPVTASSGSYSASGSVTYVVDNPVSANTAPIAKNDSSSTQQGSSITIPVLNNDSDPDGDTLRVTSVAGVNGSAVINSNNTITFTPANGYSGTEVFSYTISDGKGGTASASVSVSVAATSNNRAPVAVNDSATMSSVSSITIAVLSNDWDPDGDTIKVSSVTQGSKGSVIVNSNNTITYIPAKRFKDADSFTYTISDGSKTATATVQVSLSGGGSGSTGGGKGNGKGKR